MEGGSGNKSESGPSPGGRNPFDPANLLGSSPFLGAMSPSGGGAYPHLTNMASAFSMLGPHPLYPGGVLPFGGLGHGLDSGASGADWWRLASEQARQLAECSNSGFFPGLNGGFPSSLFGSLFAPPGGGITPSSAITSSASANSVFASPALKSPSTTSATSRTPRKHSPTSRDRAGSGGGKSRRESRSSSSRSSSSAIAQHHDFPLSSSSSKKGNKNDVSESPRPASSAVPPQLSTSNSSVLLDYSLENSLLSAEAAMYSAASPFFFPFALPSAFGGAGMMPGYGAGASSLFMPPNVSSSLFSSTPSSSFVNHSSGGASLTPKSTESTHSGRSRSRTPSVASPGVPWSHGGAVGTGIGGAGSAASPARKSVHERRDGSVIVSRGSSARTSGISEHKADKIGGGSGTGSGVGRSQHSQGGGGGGAGFSDDRRRKNVHSSSSRKVYESQSRQSNITDSSAASPPHLVKNTPIARSDDLTSYSEDGAIDLSIKKPRRDSPPASSHRQTTNHKPASASSYASSKSPLSASAGSGMSVSQANALNALVQSQQAYTEAQMLASHHQMAAAGMSDPLSFSLAAALLPQMYDGLFYPSSALAAMAAASGAISASGGGGGGGGSGSGNSAANSASASDDKGQPRRRGRRRGGSGGNSGEGRGRSRGSSGFISSIIPPLGGGHEPEDYHQRRQRGGQSRGTGSTGGGGGGGARGRGRGRGRFLSMQMMQQEAQERNETQQRLLVKQQLEAEQNLQHLQIQQQLQILQQKMTNQRSPSDRKDRESHGGKSRMSRRETLSSKLQHHQSKLALALMGGSDVSGEKMPGGSDTVGSELNASGYNRSVSRDPASTEYDSSSVNRTETDDGDTSVGSGGSGSGNDDTDVGDREGGKRWEGGSLSRPDQVGTDGSGDSRMQLLQQAADMRSAMEDLASRQADNHDGTIGRKRKFVEMDEAQLRRPLELGWQREIRISSVTPKKLIGDVVYVTPCDRLLHNIHEVEMYLEDKLKENSQDSREQSSPPSLNRDNFSFSTRYIVGKFYQSSSVPGEGYIALSDEAVAEKLLPIVARRKRFAAKKARNVDCKEDLRQDEQLSVKLAEAQFARKFDQQELARKSAELKMERKEEKQRQKEVLLRARQLRALELRKMKERQKIARQQERVDRQQQVKVQKEQRSQQIIEEKEVKRQQSVVAREQVRMQAISQQNLPDNASTWSSTSAARQMSSAISALAVSKSEASGTATAEHGITSSASSFNLSSPGSDMHYYSYLLHAAHQRQQQEQQQQQQHLKQQEQQKQLQQKQQQKEEQERHKLMLAVLGLERERRRQQVLLLKAMDARKKEEERERVKEEKKSAKKVDRDRKAEQRRVELYVARELKKPLEDMCIIDSKALPHFDRISGVRVAGKAFADCLMVLEFVHNFSSALRFDSDTLPTMNLLQNGLLNVGGESLEDFNAFITHLVKFAIDDPGVACPKDNFTLCGQRLSDVEVTENNISELMRIFIRSRNGREDEMSTWLSMLPFQSLNPTQKASVMRYFCNELLSSKSVTSEIEKNIDQINNLRRDKWTDEGKLRKLRMLLARRIRRLVPKPQVNEDSNVTVSSSTIVSTAATPVNSENGTKKELDDDSSSSDEEGLMNTAEVAGHFSETEEDQQISTEELESKIEKLVKQQNHLREKVFSISHKLSAMSLGQDRYRRRYWILPKCGGIFVEGLESAEPDSADPAGHPMAVSVDNDARISLTTGTESLSKVNPGDAANAETSSNSSAISSESSVKVGNAMFDSVDKSDSRVATTIEVLNTKIESGTDDKTVAGKLGNKVELPQSRSDSSQQLIPDGVGQFNNGGLEISKPQLTAHGFETNSSSTLKSIDDEFNEKSKNIVDQCSLTLGDVIASTVVNAVSNCESDIEMKYKCDAQAENGSDFRASLLKTDTTGHLFGDFKTESCNKKSDYNSAFLIKQDLSGDVNLALKTEIKDEVELLRTQIDKLSNLCHSGEVLDSNVPKKDMDDLDAMKSGGDQADTNSDQRSALMCTSSSTFRSIDTLLQPANKLAPTSTANTSVSVSGTVEPSSNNGTISEEEKCDAARRNLNSAMQQGVWFSLYPRTSCDLVDGQSASIDLPKSACNNQPSVNSVALSGQFSLYDQLLAVVTSGQSGQSSSGLGSSGEGAPTVVTPTPTPGCMTMILPNNSGVGLIKLRGDEVLTLEMEMNQSELCQLPFVAEPIPIDKQCGWWRITSTDRVKEFLAALNVRGIRERNLQRTLERHLDYACQSCSKNKKNVLKLEVTEESRAIAAGTVLTCPPADDAYVWNHPLHRSIEMELLEEIENMEEKVCHASLQGWKMGPRASTDKTIRLVTGNHKELGAIEQYIIEVARNKLLFLEHNVERRYLKPPLGRFNQLNLNTMSSGGSNKDSHRLGSSAAATATSSAAASVSSNEDNDSDEDDEETATKELAAWRTAVTAASSAAQLSLYLSQLNRSIAWEKSIMKVSCQICICDDNEAELLLCDICDKGYHTYCIRPKLDNIPTGDWYCYECISKASNETCCVVCGRQGARLTTCELCKRRCHIDCLDPPLARLPKKWCCHACSAERQGKLSKKKKVIRNSTSTPVKELEQELNGVDKEASDHEKETKESNGTESNGGDPDSSLKLCTPLIPDWLMSQRDHKPLEEPTRIPVTSSSKKKDRKESLKFKPIHDVSSFEYNSETDSNLEASKSVADVSADLRVSQETESQTCSETSVKKSKHRRHKHHHHHRKEHRKHARVEDSEPTDNNTKDVDTEESTRNEEVEKEAEPTVAENVNGNAAAAEDDDDDDDMSVCRDILHEMRKHDDAWPFLAPVNARQFPTYRKVIHKPIDFLTMSKKLKANQYRTPEEFADDARLVFNNCEQFNEDDSSVGRAGHSMHQFFDYCWAKRTTNR